MRKRLSSASFAYLTSILALSAAIACGGDGDGTSTPDSPLGQQMAEIGDLGDEFVGQNAGEYEGVAYAAQYVATAFETSGAAALSRKGGGGATCFGQDLAGTTFDFDAPSGKYVSTQIPGGPPGGVRFLIYRPQTDTEIGSVDVTCTGIFPSVNVNVIVTANGVDILNLLASNAYFAPNSFGATVSGLLRNADGTDEVAFGSLGTGWISIDEFSRTRSLDFEVGQETYATIMHNVSPDTGFGGYESANINVYRQQSDFIRLFDYRADLQSVDGGNLSGGGLFYAEPPAGDGFLYFVNCFDGTLDAMTVAGANASCASDYFELDPTPLPAGDIAAIQDATDALLSMFNVVSGVAEVGGTVGMAIAANQQQL